MEAFVAITGVEATPHDLAFWKDHPGRPPVLPPRKENMGGIVLHNVISGNVKGTLTTGIGGRENMDYTWKAIGGGQLDRWQLHDLCYSNKDFRDFGVEVILDTPAAFERIEIRGPVSHRAHWASRGQRKRKVDVSIEVSEDGTTFRKAGDLKGLSADVDFIPLALGDKPIKAIRMTATALPYSEGYMPVQTQGNIFDGIPHANPSFNWRLVLPK